jgi:hypothetical protein
VLSLSDLAVTYALSAELLQNTIKARVGSAIRGRLEGVLLFTPAYVRNLKAQLRGALRGAAAPAPLAAIARELGLDGAAGAGGGGGARGMLPALAEELVAEGAAAGALKGGGAGAVWTPAVYSSAQGAAVKGFYSQNGWVAYDTARRMGVANDRAYLAAAFPDGIALETGERARARAGAFRQGKEYVERGLGGPGLGGAAADRLHGCLWHRPLGESPSSALPLCCPLPLLAFVSPSLLVQLESGVDEVVSQGGWVDAATLLPPALSQGDVAALLGRCHAIASGASPERGGGRKAGGKAASAAAAVLGGGNADGPRFRKVELLAGSCVVAGPLLEALRERAEAEAKEAAERAIRERRAGGGGGGVAGSSGKGGDGGGGGGGKGGKGGQAASAAAAAAADSDDDDWGRGGKKGGKKGGKGGGKGGGGGGGKGAKGGGGGGGAAGGEAGGDPALSLGRLVDAVVDAHPDMEGAGGGPGLGLGGAAATRLASPGPRARQLLPGSAA